MTILDRYVLSQTMRRLMVALGVVLLTLVLERVLRLFEFVADNNAAFGLVLQMAANLLPHYLGLALPAAFFISILLLMAHLGDNNEIDVILGSGLSLGRMARPLILTGMIFSIASIGLLGYVQPFSRYAYRAVQHSATHALWSEAMAERTFFTPAEGVTIFANEFDLAGRGFEGVFIHQVAENGGEMTITAAKGQVRTEDATGDTKILLEDVFQLVEHPNQPPFIFFLGKLTFIPDFPFEPAPFRERGRDQRELTLDELFRGTVHPLPPDGAKNGISQRKLVAEAHGRLVRSLSVAIMPFLAVPMGMAAKRRRRGAAITVAAVMLLVYHYMLEMGEGLVGLGVVSPLIGLWLPFAVFSVICITLFRRLDQRLRPNAFEQVFDGVDSMFKALKSRVWPKRQVSE
jgi:lipopolysaccharide export system permease protein